MKMPELKGKLFSVLGVLLCFAFADLKAQKQLRYRDFGVQIGTLTHVGDVAGGDPAAVIKEIRPKFGLMYRYHFKPWFGLGVEGSYGKVFAEDSNHGNPKRNYQVDTDVLQLNGFIELSFKKFGKYQRQNSWTFFVKGGGGLVFYDPELREDARYGSNIILYPNAYTGMQMYGGGGVKIRTGYSSFISLDATSHLLLFDNLEGWEYKKNNTGNDIMASFNVGYTWMIF